MFLIVYVVILFTFVGMEMIGHDKTHEDTAIRFLAERIKLEELENRKLNEMLKKSTVILSSLRTALQAITNPGSLNLDTTSGNEIIEQKRFNYDTEISWRDKVIAYLKFKNRAVTNSEIVSAILKVEPNMTETHITNMVSGSMSNLVRDGFVEAYKPFKMKGSYYINPRWKVDGTLLDEHKPLMKEPTIW